MKVLNFKISPVFIGPVYALVSVAVLEAFDLTPWHKFLPFPVTLLVVTVIYSVFRCGRGSGLISSIITIAYFAYFLKSNDAFVKDPEDAWNRLISWTVALPVIVAIVGRLKRNALAAKADIERMTAAAKIQVYKQRADLVLENMPAVVWAVDTNGIFTLSQGKTLALLGLTEGDRLGKSIFGLYPEQTEIGKATRRALSGESTKVTFETKGFWFDCHFSPSRDPDGVITGVVGVSMNITAQVELESTKTQVSELEKAQLDLSEKTRQLESLIDSSPVGILTLDGNGKVVLWNRACEKTFGWTFAEAVGKSLPFVPHTKQVESRGIIEKIQQTREPLHFEAERVRKDGSLINTATSAIPLLDENGKVSGLLAVMIDNTERFRARQEILEANQALRLTTQAKSNFLANMSHEIRTPINGVLGMSGLLLDMDLGNEQRKYAETIRSSAQILLTLVNDILDFSKIEAGKLDLESIDFDLDGVVHSIERLLAVNAQRKNIRLVRVMSPDLRGAHFQGDPTRIGQILSNLLSNAIKFTESGQITLSVEYDLSKKNVDGNDRNIRIEVTDTGMGISEEALTRMFQPFSQADNSTTRRFGGTGLGLSICKQLVELLGGEIGVNSKEGVGSTFWFTLALRPGMIVSEWPRKTELVSDSPIVILSTPKIRILLAEDNPVNQLIAVKTLEKNGFRVDAVANGREAVEAAKHIPYDLILMDCQMPELDGYDATREIRRSHDLRVAAIPIIAMTADAMSGARDRCLGVGMNDYVTKPIKAELLVTIIHSNLAAKAA
jgi:PAS domain S-box-containing protein